MFRIFSIQSFNSYLTLQKKLPVITLIHKIVEHFCWRSLGKYWLSTLCLLKSVEKFRRTVLSRTTFQSQNTFQKQFIIGYFSNTTH